MKATLIHNNGRQRFYSLSEPISKGISLFGPTDVMDDIRRTIQFQIKEEYQEGILDSFKDGCKMIAVSDARTHIERLVFPAFIRDNGEHFFLPCEIDGKLTSMIKGGDPRSVYPDAVYLRHLCIINNLKWEGVEDGIAEGTGIEVAKMVAGLKVKSTYHEPIQDKKPVNVDSEMKAIEALERVARENLLNSEMEKAQKGYADAIEKYAFAEPSFPKEM